MTKLSFFTTLKKISWVLHMQKNTDLSQVEMRNSYTRLLNLLPGAVFRSEISERKHAFSKDYGVCLKFVSDGMYKLIDVTPDTLDHGTNLVDSLILPEDRDAVRRKIYTSFVEDRPYQMVYRMRLPSGTIKWIWEQGEVVCGESGELLFLEGIMMDLSEYKAIENSLKEESSMPALSCRTANGFGLMVGTSDPMQTLYSQIEKAAQSSSNVLILGETGTGKELCAQTIHELSGRKGAFVPVNCGAIPEQLIESEFFVHVRGAFTGAVGNRDGFIKAAHEGTLFLDEIGELPLHLQVKLLRTLESKQFTPVGSNIPQRSTFRLIAATHQNLPSMVKNKTMRSDFFYRINVLTVKIPPLRERRGDLDLLIEAYLNANDTAGQVPQHVRATMEQHSWPGNIREMHNFLERFFMFGDASIEGFDCDDCEAFFPDTDTPLEESVRAFEYRLIVQAMEKCRWRQGEAAKLLGLNLRTFQRKIKYHNLSK